MHASTDDPTLSTRCVVNVVATDPDCKFLRPVSSCQKYRAVVAAPPFPSDKKEDGGRRRRCLFRRFWRPSGKLGEEFLFLSFVPFSVLPDSAA